MATKKPGADRAAEQRRIAREIAKVGYALPGTLTVRAYRCGKANCRCHTDPAAMHGPYNYWSRKVGSVTKTRVLTDEQLEDYREWLDNARRLKALTVELHELTLAIVDEDTRGLRADRKRSATKESAPKRNGQRAAR
jgi:hypothetical protein